MKPAAFDYVRAESVPHAVSILEQAGGDGKIIAGGQSLMPMINFRLVRPAVLIDINRIAGLDEITDLGSRLRLGALVRHRMTASDPLIARDVPVLHEAMKSVAHLTVRNRGTFSGSICHADPAAEMPMLAQLLDATVHIASAAGERTMPIADFLVASLTTALDDAEMVTMIDIDKLPEGTGWGFAEFARRHGDYALAAVAALIERHDGRARNVRIAIMGVGETASRLTDVEALLEGEELNPQLLDQATALVRASIQPQTDPSASSDFRRHLAGMLARQVVEAAWARAREPITS